MTRTLLLLALALLMTASAFAQTGRITGVVSEKEHKDEPVPFATIRISQEGQPIGTAVADITGYFKSGPLAAGSYEVEVAAIGFTTTRITKIELDDSEVNLTVKLISHFVDTDGPCGWGYYIPLIDKDNTSTGRRFTAEDIRFMPVTQ